ncbi:histidine kinase osmosensor osmolarity two-component system protein SLN1, partial [Scheffersomyces coipomensis]|uniref:histidine kinase osmosensor osmolarity two-component system protein SLN1 n=1 Tax=Scheffersomyces coipomensis TaxID=1788519 RepID=UPI00315DFAC2
MRRLKIGIRPQLIILVGFSSLFSLLILAIVTGLYFTSNLSDLRAERLEVISQLKTVQVKQAVEYIFYQVYWLTTKDSIFSPLSSYRAGNSSTEIFSGAQSTLDQFLTSSELFAAARLYNLDLNVMADSYNNITAISMPAMDVLYPLSANASIPSTLLDQNSNDIQAYFTGPISNSSDPDSAYFMGITLPIYSNSSIIINTPSLSGYLTVLASAQQIQLAINDTTAGGSGTASNYNVVAVRPVFGSATSGVDNSGTASTSSHPIGFQAIFPVKDNTLLPNTIYNINTSSAIKEALTKSTGSSVGVRSYTGAEIATGFTQIQLDPDTVWAIIIEQTRATFLEPVRSLTKIIIGVVIGIGVFMCLITFPLAVFFIRPITKLREATEAITKSKKEYDEQQLSSSSHNSSYDEPNISNNSNQNTKASKRNSVNSSNSGGSVYSTAIRLPGRVPGSKKFFKDEFTELSEAFNIMTTELDKQYTHLEERVKSRTKQLEASKIEAEAANEAKTVFIANISHELRTPLNGILGMTSIAMDEKDPAIIQDSLKLIHRSGELLLHILTELLTYSKNTLNRSKLEKSNFQILEVVYQVKSIFDKLAIDQRVNFKILIRPNIFRKLIIYGDSNRIIQIVMNLVSNSLKFTPVDGSVHVGFKLLGEYDAERSKADNYAQVHVLKPRSNSNSSQGGNTTLTKSSGSIKSNTYYKTKPVPKVDNPDAAPSLLSIEKEKLSEDDNLSILTLSTTEYENKIFESQFSHYKPLPRLPNDTVALQQLQPRKIEELDTNRLRTEKTHSRNLSSSSSSIPSTDKFPTATILNKNANNRPEYTSSNMANSELVKNNKAFKIRRIYKPKTWVIQIEVTDTGPGIEPALQEKVFEPFVQGDQTLSRSYGGTGLGLSICRQLATMMKGTLSLKSAIGVGSTFTFTVPLPQTGEIMVSDEEMNEFCEDEFNANSKINRKVSFKNTFDDEVYGDDDVFEHDTTEGSDDHDDVQGSQPVEPSTTDEGYEEDESIVEDLVNVEAKPLLIKHSSRRPTRISPPYPLTEEERSSSGSSGGSNPKVEKPKFDRNHFDKPLLLTRSSTGTASSSTGSERMEIHNNILDELNHLKILVAEDNLVNQEVIKRMLKLEGFDNVTLACNGAEAVELVKESLDRNEPFDLVFMDVQMPKVDGLLATKMIRNNLQYEKPIIALTAFADESNVKECLSSGMSGFLSKPIRRTNLRKIIIEFSPILLSNVVTTPHSYHGDE